MELERQAKLQEEADKKKRKLEEQTERKKRELEAAAAIQKQKDDEEAARRQKILDDLAERKRAAKEVATRKRVEDDIQSMLKEGNSERANAIYKKLVKLEADLAADNNSNKTVDNEFSLEHLLARAKESFENEKFNYAALFCSVALQTDEINKNNKSDLRAEFYEIRSLSYRHLSYLECALDDATQLCLLRATSPEAHKMRAEISEQLPNQVISTVDSYKKFMKYTKGASASELNSILAKIQNAKAGYSSKKEEAIEKGMRHFDRRDWGAALECFNKVQQFTALDDEDDDDDFDLDLHSKTSICACKLGKLDEAKEEAKLIVSKLGNSPVGYLLLAEAFEKEKNFEECLKNADKCMQLMMNNNKNASSYPIIIREKLDQVPEMKARTKIAILKKLAPSMSQEELQDHADEFQLRGPIQTAIHFYSLVIEKGGKLANKALRDRYQCYCTLDKFDEALDDATRLCQLEPACAEHLGRHGLAAQNLRKWTLALESFEKYLERDPSDSMRLAGMRNLAKQKCPIEQKKRREEAAALKREQEKNSNNNNGSSGINKEQEEAEWAEIERRREERNRKLEERAQQADEVRKASRAHQEAYYSTLRAEEQERASRWRERRSERRQYNRGFGTDIHLILYQDYDGDINMALASGDGRGGMHLSVLGSFGGFGGGRSRMPNSRMLGDRGATTSAARQSSFVEEINSDDDY